MGCSTHVVPSLIERDDTRRRRHELRTRLVGGRLHEFEDGPLGGAVVPGEERIRLCAHTCVREDHNAERERYRAATSRTTRKTDRKLHASGLLYAPPHRVNDSSLPKATGKVCPSAAWKYVRDQRQAGPDGIVPVINAAGTACILARRGTESAGVLRMPVDRCAASVPHAARRRRKRRCRRNRCCRQG